MSGRARRPNQRAFIRILHASGASSPFASSSDEVGGGRFELVDLGYALVEIYSLLSIIGHVEGHCLVRRLCSTLNKDAFFCETYGDMVPA